MKLKVLYLLGFILFLSTIDSASYASRPGFDTKFFQDIGDIYISVIVINGDEKEVRELPSDEKIFNTQITPLEIKQAVFDSFKSQYKDTGVKIYGTGELTEKPERLILPEERKDPNADPFDFSNTQDVKNLEVLFYIVLTRQLEDSKEIVFGAISSKTLKDEVGRFKKGTDLRLEGLSQPFLIFSDKQKTLEEIKDKTVRVFQTQRLWILCKKLQTNIPCSNQEILLEELREAEKKAGKEMALMIKERVSGAKKEQLKKSCKSAKQNDPEKREFEPVIGRYLASKSRTDLEPIGDDFDAPLPRPPEKPKKFSHKMVWLTERGHTEVFVGGLQSEMKEFFSKMETVLGAQAIRESKDTAGIFGICGLKNTAQRYGGNIDSLMNMQE